MADFGVVGLGRIGGGLALSAMAKGFSVAGFDPAPLSDELSDAGLVRCGSLSELAASLKLPRIIFLYIHAGKAIGDCLAELEPVLSPGDVVVDGGNSYWGDSIVRARLMAEKGLHLVDLGTSGGVTGARNGACFMAGGDPAAYALIQPILSALAVPGGLVYAGQSGAGHYVKLVHNGIEFGMMQAIGEGLALLEASELEPNIAGTLEAWRHGSVIRSWLVDLLAEAYAERDGLQETPNWIEDTGEVNWLVQDAVRMEVPAPVIAQSVFQLFASRDKEMPWAKAIALMRLGFGGHNLGPQPALAQERKTMRVGGVREPS